MNKLRLSWLVVAPIMGLWLFVSFHMSSLAQAARPAAEPVASQKNTPSTPAGTQMEPVTVNQSDVEWQTMVPEMGKYSPMRAVLHEHPMSHSAQYLIRMPPNFHVPAHFHSANETHTVIEGTFIISVKGKKVALSPGGFNYTPARMMHEAWTPPNQGALIFVTIDGPYDILQSRSDWGEPVAGH